MYEESKPRGNRCLHACVPAMHHCLFIFLAVMCPLLAASLVSAEVPKQPAAVPEWLADFENPPATYRPQMFWVWNGKVSRERTTEVMEQYAARGVGGVFVHPRPGLITEYLSREFFEQWKWTLSECKRLKMECHIYDENGFPSGFAGGEVMAADPTLAARFLTPIKITDPQQELEESVIAYFVKEKNEPPRSVDEAAVQSATKTRPIWAVVVKQVPPKPQHGGFPYPDMLRQETTEIFLRVTHDRYAALFEEDFGDAIKYVFTDEPTVVGASGYPWSDYLLGEFQQEHGYDLREKVATLCFGGPESTAVRHDYYQTVGRLWIQNCFKPIYEWCDRHNLAFTGHLWEHQWPVPEKQPLVMHTYRWMQAPGTDLLGFHFFPTKFRDQALAYLNQKELSSIGNQLGRKRLLCESSGAGGYEMALRDFKPLEDFLLAAGVNVMTPHLSYQTFAGARKYDWPQTISDHSSWWDGYAIQADHVGRVAYALDQGRERNRVLVLHPCTTGWMRYQHKDFLLGDESGTNVLEEIGSAQQQFLADLHAAQIDFDLGDELTMAELGSVDGKRLRIGKATYDAVVVPPAMENWTPATLERMGDYLEAGGFIYASKSAPAFVDGRASGKAAYMAENYAKQWKASETNEETIAKLREAFPPRVTRPDGSQLPIGLCWRRSERPDGSIVYFFCHPWNEPCRTEVRLEGRSLIGLDTVRGEAVRVESKPEKNGQVTLLDLPPCGHALLIASPDEALPVPASEPTQWYPVNLESQDIERKAPNVLALLFCDLEAGETTAEGINTTLADEMNWKAHGLQGNIWSLSSQFRRTLIDMEFPADSGFRVTYHFTVDEGAGDKIGPSLELAMERPWLYDITLNGKTVRFEDERWLDPDIRKTSIPSEVQTGSNTVAIEVRPMRPLCEIMPVYLLGDFGLEPAERGFTLTEASSMKLGPWTEQGMPFYPERAGYRYRFSLDESVKKFNVHLPGWSGSAARVIVDGRDCGVIAWPPDRLEVEQPLSAGPHDLEIVVAGNMKNLMGPHFSDGLPGIWSWRWSGQKTQPPKKYQFAPCGLFEDPELSIAR
ncbi:MAG: glycosyl hydrolase [bacterium]